MRDILIKLRQQREIQDQKVLSDMEKLVTSLFKAIASTNELVGSDSAIIERDNEVFDRVASWFRDLRTALGYDENSEKQII